MQVTGLIYMEDRILADTLADLGYTEGTRWRVEAIADHVYKVAPEHLRRDRDTVVRSWGTGGAGIVDLREAVTMPDTQELIIRTALGLLLRLAEHECREQFTYRGARVFDPHQNIIPREDVPF